MWPSFIEGAHHRVMCEQFNKIARGELRRVIINMAPRHSKSEMSSYMLPSWLLGIKPDLKIIQATHTGELAVRFGRKVRDLVDTREYKEIFPNVSLRADSKAAGRWETTESGEYFASGVGGAMGLNVRVETEMFEKNDTEELSSVFVRSINQTIFEDRAINDIKYKIGAMDNKGCKKVEWDQKLMDGLKGSVVSQIDGEYNTKKNIISLAIWIKIGWMPAVALYATMKSVPAAIGPY